MSSFEIGLGIFLFMLLLFLVNKIRMIRATSVTLTSFYNVELPKGAPQVAILHFHAKHFFYRLNDSQHLRSQQIQAYTRLAELLLNNDERLIQVKEIRAKSLTIIYKDLGLSDVVVPLSTWPKRKVFSLKFNQALLMLFNRANWSKHGLKRIRKMMKSQIIRELNVSRDEFVSLFTNQKLHQDA